jgi:hypothetical protein
MLFYVNAKHSVETCPGGNIHPDKEFTTKVSDALKRSGVTVVASFVDAPGHEYHFFIEAETNEALNNAVEPFRLIGDVWINPVMRFDDTIAWAKKIGIQR